MALAFEAELLATFGLMHGSKPVRKSAAVTATSAPESGASDKMLVRDLECHSARGSDADRRRGHCVDVSKVKSLVPEAQSIEGSKLDQHSQLEPPIQRHADTKARSAATFFVGNSKITLPIRASTKPAPMASSEDNEFLINKRMAAAIAASAMRRIASPELN